VANRDIFDEIADERTRSSIRNKRLVVIDRGFFFHIAQRLAREAKHVDYYLAEEDPNPRREADEIGKGYPDVHVTDNLGKAIDKADIIVYTDCNNAGWPQWYKKHGHNVYGALASETLEVDRLRLKAALKAAKLPVVPFETAKGLNGLRSALKGKTDKWIKTSYSRGNFETYHYKNEFLASSFFKSLENAIGLVDDMTFIIEENIEADIEIGFEAPMLNGEIPENAMVGYECKDKAYLGKVFAKLPEVLDKQHKKLAPAFKLLGYQGWYSCETRITPDEISYYTDCTARIGCPPGGSYSELYTNFAQTVCDLAYGKLPKLKAGAKYAAELVLFSEHNQKLWLPVEYPDQDEQWYKLKCPKRVGKGQAYILPHGTDGYFGTVVAIGDTLEEAEALCLERAAKLEGEEVQYDKHAFDEIHESIEKGKKHGVKF
jgi:hypothetical protein